MECGACQRTLSLLPPCPKSIYGTQGCRCRVAGGRLCLRLDNDDTFPPSRVENMTGDRGSVSRGEFISKTIDIGTGMPVRAYQ